MSPSTASSTIPRAALHIADECGASVTAEREIAHDLVVTLNTVKTHMRHVFRKLRVNARGEIEDKLHAPRSGPLGR